MLLPRTLQLQTLTAVAFRATPPCENTNHNVHLQRYDSKPGTQVGGAWLGDSSCGSWRNKFWLGLVGGSGGLVVIRKNYSPLQIPCVLQVAQHPPTFWNWLEDQGELGFPVLFYEPWFQNQYPPSRSLRIVYEPWFTQHGLRTTVYQSDNDRY